MQLKDLLSVARLLQTCKRDFFFFYYSNLLFKNDPVTFVTPIHNEFLSSPAKATTAVFHTDSRAPFKWFSLISIRSSIQALLDLY